MEKRLPRRTNITGRDPCYITLCGLVVGGVHPPYHFAEGRLLHETWEGRVRKTVFFGGTRAVRLRGAVLGHIYALLTLRALDIGVKYRRRRHCVGRSALDVTVTVTVCL